MRACPLCHTFVCSLAQAAEGLDGDVIDMDPNAEAPPGGASIHDVIEEEAAESDSEAESEGFSD